MTLEPESPIARVLTHSHKYTHSHAHTSHLWNNTTVITSHLAKTVYKTVHKMLTLTAGFRNTMFTHCCLGKAFRLQTNLMCLHGTKALHLARIRSPLISWQWRILPWVIRIAQCSFEAVDRGAWNESEIKNCTWVQALLLHDLLHRVNGVSLWGAPSGAGTDCIQPSNKVKPATKWASILTWRPRDIQNSTLQFSFPLCAISACFADTAGHHTIRLKDCLLWSSKNYVWSLEFVWDHQEMQETVIKCIWGKHWLLLLNYTEWLKGNLGTIRIVRMLKKFGIIILIVTRKNLHFQ